MKRRWDFRIPVAETVRWGRRCRQPIRSATISTSSTPGVFGELRRTRAEPAARGRRWRDAAEPNSIDLERDLD
jgi:hypothetical protein